MTARFDIDADLVRRLAEILNETGLGEIEYAEGERRIRVARPAIAAGPSAAPASAPSAPAAAPSPVGGVPEGAITAPMVGTAYLTQGDGAPPFVKQGDHVREGQTVLIIEAMKVMNAIRSPRAGTVKQIMVANGAPVEYGEPLIVLE